MKEDVVVNRDTEREGKTSFSSSVARPKQKKISSIYAHFVNKCPATAHNFVQFFLHWFFSFG